MDPRDGRGLDRREFVKSAVAIGGASALSACLDRLPGDGRDVPEGGDPSTLPARQHAWNEFLPTDEHGNDVMARHHVLAYLDYAGDGTPTDAERETVETALRSLERAYEYSNEGLLFTVGYSPSYFERFDEPLPESVDLPAPEPMSSFEDPTFDEQDVLVHFASDHADVVLEAEQALLGERDAANDRELDADLAGVLERADRRTGFVGKGLPAENSDVDGIPDDADVDEDAPLYMGFKSGFKKNQATEDRVTIQSGPFQDATTQHVSKIRLRLDDWYGEQDQEDRVAEMFCPAHADNDVVEGVGENLGDGTKVNECPAHLDETAQEYGRVGHNQKTAQARDENDSPRILRRDFDSTDGGEAGLHFLAVQRTITDFKETREAMNGTDATENPAIRQRVNNGILEYTFVRRRGNFLLPPRKHRALPTPRPE
ncbi:Dyp-type peroxidase [Halorubellus salinus]|uniref:Dyp-type peroxidase n=1 Tax=Halorubellus salinus TaxID=755309 RepID=UPI001D0635FD|nr:Dyp-type peroxidase [Halorubellus salinus]